MAVHTLYPVKTRVGARRWRERLPVLAGERVVLRELRATDAPALFAMVSPPEVSRFISPPPPSVEAFARFIATSLAKQGDGKLAVFAVTLKRQDTPIGVFQVRSLDPTFSTAEWGFALGSAFWGTGLFEEAAELVLAFAFNTIGVHRLEARAAVRNGRGNRALRKMGAVPEGILRQAFLCEGDYVDQMIYSLIEEDWRAACDGNRGPAVVVH